MKVAAVVLAAGAASRFGSPKLLQRIGSATLLEHVLALASECGLDPIVAVVPPRTALPDEVLGVVNDDPSAGISRSVRMGLAAVPPEADAALILLADEPTLPADAVLEVLVAAADHPDRIMAARAGERLGPPVLLPRASFGLADELGGDQGLGRVLRGRPDVIAVAIGAQPADIDTPADLDAVAPRCPGCGARFPANVDGPTHAYMISSPGCWAAFTALVAREFDQAAYGSLHRHTVDAYAAQHPDHDDRRARQSVAVHLIGLCHWLEHGMPARVLTPITQALTAEPRDWPLLEPPAAYPITAVDVLAAATAEQHLRLVREWAEATWRAWSAHHDLIRAWAADALAKGPAR